MVDNLSPFEAMAIIRLHLDGAEVVKVGHAQYIERYRHSPFVRAQITAGIYEEDSLSEEFLSPACSFPGQNVVEVDVELVCLHMKGVPKPLAYSYCAYLALHEKHHLDEHTGPAVDIPQQVERERECDTYLQNEWPEVVRDYEEAINQSAVFQRVFQRIAALRPTGG